MTETDHENATITLLEALAEIVKDNLHNVQPIDVHKVTGLLNNESSTNEQLNNNEEETHSESFSNLTKRLLEIIKPLIPIPRNTFECLICFEIKYVDDGCLGCSRVSEEETEDKHLICVECLQGYAHTACFEAPVAPGGAGLKCVDSTCENIILLSEFENYLKDDDYIPLMRRLQEQCVLDAGLAELVRCPQCNFQMCVEFNVTFYTCGNCGRNLCRNCPRIYDANHQERTCQQMDEYETQQASMRKLEPQMSEAVIRKCHRCNLAFIKETGCNKMTCRCSATQCYICREPDINYNHFCHCKGQRSQGKCTRCFKCYNSEVAGTAEDNVALQNLQNKYHT